MGSDLIPPPVFRQEQPQRFAFRATFMFDEMDDVTVPFMAGVERVDVEAVGQDIADRTGAGYAGFFIEDDGDWGE